MKKVLLFFVLACLFLASPAQRSEQGRKVLNEKCQTRYLASFYNQKEKNTSPAIKQLEVVDCRPDTMRLGFLTHMVWKDIRFRKGLRQEAQLYLDNSYAHPGGTQSLLVLIKKCWLYDTVLATPMPELMAAGKGRILFRAEVYLKTPDGLAPYAYLDTVVMSTARAVNIIHSRLPVLLTALMDKVAAVDESIVLSRNRYYSRHTIDSLNNRQFAYAIDTAQRLRKGVYANVEEFRNNQPSILNYQVEKNKEGNLDLYIKDEAGKLYFSRKMWGYCDGEYCYAMMDGNLFPVVQVDHAFYVLGARQYQRKQTYVPLLMVIPGAYVFGLEAIAETAVRKLSLFHLDVYSGHIN